jgi:hypothetical protein
MPGPADPKDHPPNIGDAGSPYRRLSTSVQIELLPGTHGYGTPHSIARPASDLCSPGAASSRPVPSGAIHAAGSETWPGLADSDRNRDDITGPDTWQAVFVDK